MFIPALERRGYGARTQPPHQATSLTETIEAASFGEIRAAPPVEVEVTYSHQPIDFHYSADQAGGALAVGQMSR